MENEFYHPEFLQQQLNNAWGIEVNPNSHFRVIGNIGDSASAIYKDVLNTGQIRGSNQFAGDAYFHRGQPLGTYLENRETNKLLKHYPKEQVGNNNYLIEATEDFNPTRNPLYKGNESIKYRRLPTIGGIPAPSELAFPISNSGSRWIPASEVPTNFARSGLDSVAAPVENPSFLDRINPANQRGIRMGQAYTPYFVNVPKGFEGGAPNWDWKFDYTKPFTETSMKQHAKNVQHIGRTVLAQPETKAVLKGAGTAAKVGVGTAGLIAYAKGVMEDAPKTITEWGVPFTPLKMGTGPVLELGKGSDMESRGRWVYDSKKDEMVFKKNEK